MNLHFFALLYAHSEIVHCLLESGRIKVKVDPFELAERPDFSDVVVKLRGFVFFIVFRQGTHHRKIKTIK